MANRSLNERLAISARFMDMMQDAEFRQLTQHQMAERVGTSDHTINRLMKSITPAEWDIWREQENRLLAPKEMKVDDSLYKRALDGDVGAIKLWYQKKMGWSERTTNENINREGGLSDKSDEELREMMRKEALRQASPEELAAALKEKELKVIDPAANGQG